MNKEWPLKKGLSSSASVLQGNDSHLKWHQRWSKRLSNLYSSPLSLGPWGSVKAGLGSQGCPATPAKTFAAEDPEAALGTGGTGWGWVRMWPCGWARGRTGLCQARAWPCWGGGWWLWVADVKPWARMVRGVVVVTVVVTVGHWQQLLETSSLAKAMTFCNGSSTEKCSEGICQCSVEPLFQPTSQ